ncbi:MAG TPA: ATP-binding cassette domain-containing protein, partial [bacterium]
MPPFAFFDEVYKQFDGKEVLRGLTLVVRKGELLMILGGSGMGKTVILKHIVGLLKPDSGRIYVDGEDITDMEENQLIPIRRRIGFLFQGGALFDSMTVFENVAFPLREHTRLSQKEIVE